MMERQREEPHHYHRHHRPNYSDQQEQLLNYYQHQHQLPHAQQHQLPHPQQHQHAHPQQHQHAHPHQHQYFNPQDPFAGQSQDHQFNYHNNHDNHSSNGTNSQPRSVEPNESFGGSGGGGLFSSNDRKRGRYLSGRVSSPDHMDDAVSVKLYVAPIVRTATDEEIRPLFEPHGSVVEVIFPKDKRSGQQQGYCFVKYATKEEADRAIRALNGQYIVPGEVAPIKVRYADGERERFGKVERDRLGKGEREHPGGGEFVDKLYVGGINKQASKQDIEEVFSPYGHVEDVYIARDALKQSRGCAFIRFSHRDMAVAAMKALNGTFTMKGCDQPLTVRFADPKKRRTGEFRGNYGFGGQNFGPCSQEPMMRPAPNFGDSIGVCNLPNPSYPVQEISINSQSQAFPHTIQPAIGAPHIIEQPIPPVRQPPTQLSQIPLQQTQASQKCLQPPQEAVSEMMKYTHNLEQQETLQIPLESQWTESNTLAVSVTSAAPAVPASPQTADPQECDWSEHSCPDGYKYYYNCTTCESRWEKPDEFTLFQQQLQKQKLPISRQQPCSLSASFCGEELDHTQKDLDHLQIQSETRPVIDPVCI
ncbi:flowering time control protein FCA isoform X1 [Jatropha curcas]|nr:flowering time control protein FCA isoform X1 [Jatropha curcas]